MTASDKIKVLRPQVQAADGTLRPTRAEIDLDAIAQNLHTIRRRAQRAKVLAVVKADAYGHGVVPVAKRLQLEGVDGFGVALAEEGLELRAAGIDRAILVLNGIHGGAHRDVVAAGLTPVVYELAEARAFEAVSEGRDVDVHLKVDTGMGRLGVPFAELEAFLSRLRDCHSIRIAGLMTHLATADEDREFVALQLRRFAEAHRQVQAFGYRPVVRHVANSAGLFRHEEARFDWVRPGLALFGYPGGQDIGAPLVPAMRWRTEVISVKTIAPGESVGYGRSFRATSPTRAAMLPVGYGDGLLRALSNRGTLLLRGQRCPILGNVSMDLTAIDVTHVPDAQIGDEALILGEQGGEHIDAEEVAAAAGTIAYEVLTNVSRRVPRFYRGNAG